MTIHLPLFPNDKTILPTGKFHISFSEMNCCSGTYGCSHRHKLTYVDGHKDGGSEHTAYGSALHAALEEWLLQKDSKWFSWEVRIRECCKEVFQEFERLGFNPGSVDLAKSWINPINELLEAVPGWMEETFPGYKVIASELELFEPIEGLQNRWFKGFIDAVIKIPKPVRKGSKKPSVGSLYYVLDWKTTSWGWSSDKKQDKYQRMQLALYKHFLSVKLGIPLEDIRCGFVLLKRTAKKGNQCELVEVSVGDKTREDALRLISSTLGLISKKLILKNRNSCRFCPFKDTELCP